MREGFMESGTRLETANVVPEVITRSLWRWTLGDKDIAARALLILKVMRVAVPKEINENICVRIDRASVTKP